MTKYTKWNYDRHLHLVKLICEGYQAGVAAHKMGIDPSTVSNALAAIGLKSHEIRKLARQGQNARAILDATPRYSAQAETKAADGLYDMFGLAVSRLLALQSQPDLFIASCRYIAEQERSARGRRKELAA